MPFPTTRQTLQEMLMDEEEKDFWDDAEPAPAQERATVVDAPGVKRCGGVRYEKVARTEERYVRKQTGKMKKLEYIYTGFNPVLQYIPIGYYGIASRYYHIPIRCFYIYSYPIIRYSDTM